MENMDDDIDPDLADMLEEIRKSEENERQRQMNFEEGQIAKAYINVHMCSYDPEVFDSIVKFHNMDHGTTFTFLDTESKVLPNDFIEIMLTAPMMEQESLRQFAQDMQTNMGGAREEAAVSSTMPESNLPQPPAVSSLPPAVVSSHAPPKKEASQTKNIPTSIPEQASKPHVEIKQSSLKSASTSTSTHQSNRSTNSAKNKGSSQSKNISVSSSSSSSSSSHSSHKDDAMSTIKITLISDFRDALIGREERFIRYIADSTAVEVRISAKDRRTIILSSSFKESLDAASKMINDLLIPGNDHEEVLSRMIPPKTAIVQFKDASFFNFLTANKAAVLRYFARECGINVVHIDEKMSKITIATKSGDSNMLDVLQQILDESKTCRQMVENFKSKKIHIFVDISNILVGADECRHDSTTNTDVQMKPLVKPGPLMEIVKRLRTLGSDAVAVGTTPSRESKSWNMWRDAGFDVTILDAVISGGKSTEQTIDDILHAKILLEVTKKFPDQRTLVLLTGDGNNNHNRTSFVDDCEIALRNGWRVEVWTWRESCSRKFKEYAEIYTGIFTINYLDEHRPEILKWETRRPRPDTTTVSNASQATLQSTSQTSNPIESMAMKISNTKLGGGGSVSVPPPPPLHTNAPSVTPSVTISNTSDEKPAQVDPKRVSELLFQFIQETQPEGRLEAIYMSEFYKLHDFARDVIRDWKLKKFIETFGRGKLEWVPDDRARGRGWIKLKVVDPGAKADGRSFAKGGGKGKESESLPISRKFSTPVSNSAPSSSSAIDFLSNKSDISKSDNSSGMDKTDKEIHSTHKDENGGHKEGFDVSKIKKAKSEMTEYMLQCPLSNTRMHDPTLVPCCGMTFERSAIVKHVETKGTCPSPRCMRPLEQGMLVSNNAMKKVIEKYYN